ncbi:MAG: hypothetical protein Q7S42_04500 [Candidatus Omnitrophota bacterium]|nr:hypothetical protein [Candidatus Omnitrophota bacterium]
MYIKSKSGIFFVVIFLLIIIVFLYSLGMLHSFACASQNPVLLSVLAFIENIMGVSYPLGTKTLNGYMSLTNCSF